MNFFDQKDVGNHPLKLCPKVVKHPVYSGDSNTVTSRYTESGLKDKSLKIYLPTEGNT
jgi:hypothetical protein